jgi:hypothetical protein
MMGRIIFRLPTMIESAVQRIGVETKVRPIIGFVEGVPKTTML